MARVVESVVPEFGDAVCVEIVYTRDLSGALRYAEISRRLGRPAPVPAILIEDELVFEQTPPAEALQTALAERCRQKSG